jgi:hypothetical protein
LPKLMLPWGEEIHVENMEQFTLDIMMLTAEYRITQPDTRLVVVTSSDFILEDDDETFNVRTCTIRVIVEWEEDKELDAKWEDFTSIDMNDMFYPRRRWRR